LDSFGAMVGDRIEVCPNALALTQDIANRIARVKEQVQVQGDSTTSSSNKSSKVEFEKSKNSNKSKNSTANSKQQQQQSKRSKPQGGGAAIFIDYGADHALANSLRGFHKHTESHILARPGEVCVQIYIYGILNFEN
jgi:hypothetical protein